ncbi:glycosyltransferase [Lentisphaerota bacterium WC36G]|nr:glycosyltransferase [Lentisphaerae bacterium WC36]
MNTKLTILLITYNHEKTIEQSINSILEQKTNFEFIINVLDDASTDNSSNIVASYVAKYPSKIKYTLRKKNVGVVQNIFQGIKDVKTQYYATCEGDDYWCDENKIQMQVDFLDNNSDYSFSGHNTIFKSNNGEERKIFSEESYTIKSTYSMPLKFSNKNFVKVHPSSRVYRTSCIDFANLKFPDSIIWDSCSYWYFLAKGKLHYIDKVMSIYQYTEDGIFSGSSSRKQRFLACRNILNINKEFDYKYNNIFIQQLKPLCHDLNLSIKERFLMKLFPRFFTKKGDELLEKFKIELLYSDYKNNFGDMLSPEILGKYVNCKIEKNQCLKSCDTVFIGSHLELFLKDKTAKINKNNKTLNIVGTGFIAPENYYDDKAEEFSRNVRIFGCRGELTKNRLEKIIDKKLTNITLGDPGLLASRIFDTSNVTKKYKVGVIAHYIDENSPALENINIENILLIDIKDSTKNIVENITSCEFILSSAMHGLIVADSFNIPNRRIILSDNVEGGNYKFDDYYSIYKEKVASAIDLRNEVIIEENIESLKKEYHIKKDEITKIQNNLELMLRRV